jgi:hypothetical protein
LSNENYKKTVKSHFPVPAWSDIKTQRATSSSEHYTVRDLMTPTGPILSQFHRLSMSMLSRGIDSWKAEKQPIFESMFFHRVVFDEFHEIHMRDVKFKIAASLLQGSNYWGLTGTPHVGTREDIVSMAKYLHIDIEHRGTVPVCHDFMKKFVTRNEPELNLPPKTEAVVWVDLTPEERGLYHTASGGNPLDQLMCCCHYQLADVLLEQVTTFAIYIYILAYLSIFARLEVSL